MAKKKPTTRKKRAAKKKPVRRKSSARRKTPIPGKRVAGAKKTSVGRKAARAKPVKRVQSHPRSSGVSPLGVAARPRRRGLGAISAGQSGDTQGLSRATDVDSESVEELLEEGQTAEAGVVGGVERADADQGEVRTTQFNEDDVPREYDTD
jgi:hypothetical protein